ncbi:MAG: hypothetical protein RLZZ08_125 [Pseudomonadota bacterium]|jgi:hypothetical protein
MSFTFVGLLQLVIGSILLFRSLPAMLMFLLASGLFGGSAALTMPAIGNSSVPPIQFALLFVYIRLLMPRGGYFAVWTQGIRDNFMLVLFTFYGMVAAYAGPRIFAGRMNVAPVRFENPRNLFDAIPLEPTSQNFTASIYLLCALLAALAAYAIVRSRAGVEMLVKGGVVIAWVHALSGLIASLTKGTPLEEVFSLFRNGNYAQLDQAYQGFNRVDGFFPEASGWAAFGIAWFVFNCECWYRSVWSKHTGRAALLLGAVLFFSTSSTAYVGIGCYLVFFIGRLLVMPASVQPVRLKQGLLAMFSMMVMAAVAMAAIPHFAAQVVDMILHMTVDKGDSLSGQQRLFWAMQGFTAFEVSAGVGIGPGSFRSSSLLTAILGTMGVVGVLTFAGYVFSVLRPLPTRGAGGQGAGGQGAGGGAGNDAVVAVMEACATTAFIVLIPAAISSPNSHPGTNFSILAGAALALRHIAMRSGPASQPDQARQNRTVPA